MTTTLEHLPDPYQVAREAADAIAEASGAPTHDLALVLGSGWAGAADLLGRTVWEADATTIPGFRPPAVAGHAGVLRSIEVEGSGARVLVLGARTHLYEGAGVDPVVHGVRTAAAAGCGTMVLTNGCGGVDPARPPGTDRKSTRLNSSHVAISYAVFCLKKKIRVRFPLLTAAQHMQQRDG